MMNEVRGGALFKAVSAKRARVAGLPVAAALIAVLILVAPPLSPAAAGGIGEIERTGARSVAVLGEGTGFVFESVFDAMKGASIQGGFVEYTEGFFAGLYVVEVHHGGAFIKFFFGIESGQPVTVTFHVLYVTPDGVPGEFVKSVTYLC